ncbi:hypothetical protein H4R35_001370 [Dimargaris xerosporica]|nr:hypothetical protein H4R35_001370 [Dimargaris xerosporica]
MKSVLILGTLMVLATFAQLPATARPTDSLKGKSASTVDPTKIEVPSNRLAASLGDTLEEFGANKCTVKLSETEFFKYVKSKESEQDGEFITKTIVGSSKVGLAKIVEALISQGKSIIDAAPNKKELDTIATNLASIKVNSANSVGLSAVQRVLAAFEKLEAATPSDSFRVKGYFASVHAQFDCIAQKMQDKKDKAEAKTETKIKT